MQSSPLQGRYTPMLAAALLALIPYILITSAAPFYREQVMRDLGTNPNALSVVSGLSVAGYAFGALFSGDLINRFKQRNLFIVQEIVFILGWGLAAGAPEIYSYGTGRVLAGFATGMLLVTALPPVIRRFPPERLPLTAAFINIAFFGAIAAGPLLGGAIFLGHVWRAMDAGFSALGALAILLAVLSFPPADPPNPAMKFDVAGLALGFGATALMFWGSGELRGHGFADPIVAVPLGLGCVCFVALMLVEYHKQEPLAPVKKMWTTIPVVGTLIAMAGGGVFVTFVELLSTFLMRVEHKTPLAAGLLFWPQLVGAVITAALLGLLFRTRYLPVLIFSGMLLLIGGGALLLVYDVGAPRAIALAAAGLLGLGAGATVSPALFITGFPLQVSLLGRIFALIELVRSVADFILSPVLLKIARVSSVSAPAVSANGIHEAVLVTLTIAAASTAIPLALLLLGGAGLPKPDIAAWLKQNKPAIHSPPLLALLRRRDR